MLLKKKRERKKVKYWIEQHFFVFVLKEWKIGIQIKGTTKFVNIIRGSSKPNSFNFIIQWQEIFWKT